MLVRNVTSLGNVLAGAGVIPVKMPGEGVITRVRVSQAAGGAFNSIGYSRRVPAGTSPISAIVNDGNGYVKILGTSDLRLLRVGDTITVAATGVAGYNTTHTVTAVDSQAGYVVTNVAFSSAVGAAGTWILSMTAGRQAIFEVWPSTAAAAGVVKITNQHLPFSNDDSQLVRADDRYLYVYADAAGTYDISVSIWLGN
jgi:hypothetical protein